MPRSMQVDKERIVTSTPEYQAGVRVFGGATCWSGSAVISTNQIQ